MTSTPEKSLAARLIAGRAFLIIRLVLFLATLVSLFMDHNYTATVFLLGSLFMGMYGSFQIRHDDIEKPFALFWLKLGDKLLVNALFVALALRLSWAPHRELPVILYAG